MTINGPENQTIWETDRFTSPSIAKALATRTVRKSNVRSHIAWATGGFLLGAFCWHLIGFWGFVNAVLLQEDRRGTLVGVVNGEKGTISIHGARKSTARLTSVDNDCTRLISSMLDGESIAYPCGRPIVAMNTPAADPALLVQTNE